METTESPWICPDCGTPNNHTNCDKCFRAKPLNLPVFNQTGSYFRIVYGPVGFFGLPTLMAAGILLIIFTIFALSGSAMIQSPGIQSKPETRIIP